MSLLYVSMIKTGSATKPLSSWNFVTLRGGCKAGNYGSNCSQPCSSTNDVDPPSVAWCRSRSRSAYARAIGVSEQLLS